MLVEEGSAVQGAVTLSTTKQYDVINRLTSMPLPRHHQHRCPQPDGPHNIDWYGYE